MRTALRTRLNQDSDSLRFCWQQKTVRGTAFRLFLCNDYSQTSNTNVGLLFLLFSLHPLDILTEETMKEDVLRSWFDASVFSKSQGHVVKDLPDLNMA